MPVPAGKAIRVTGIVQGVGFRPFVRNSATELGLTGDVRNDVRGVLVRLRGSPAAIESFMKVLENSPPPLAVIDTIITRDLEPDELSHLPETGFRIIASAPGGERSVVVTPDAAVCGDCRREMLDPDNRRYRYPFINCTNCGPRYTIIEDVPYDRPNTTMVDFDMCAPCRKEYEDPGDRRYHAQPTCCPTCGPSLQLASPAGDALAGDPVEETARLLASGKILAIKGLGGFHLACDAQNEEAVVRLRERKRREEKPFAVMARDVCALEKIVELPDYAPRLLGGPVSPILIAKKRLPDRLAPSVSPVTDHHGVMLPYTPVHILLFEESACPEYLVMTSGNLTDEPICIENAEALERLCGTADAFLLHDRRIALRIDDSVLLSTETRPTVIRRARGYVPSGLETGRDTDGIVAYGPFMKNTIAVGRATAVYPGQHIGDLDNKAALDMFFEVKKHLLSLLGVKPRLAACDLHPEYPTTRLAEESGLPVARVQHHHAHLVSLMAERRRYEKAIGFAFDGTGWGDDGQVWGGEVLLFDPEGYRRAFHLEYVPLPGGDAAARQPWRMALVYLRHAGLEWRSRVRAAGAEQVAALLESGLPLIYTSSAGRLFDAVSSLCGLCDFSTFEAKAPMRLEGVIPRSDVNRPGPGEHYEFSVEASGAGAIRTADIIRGIVADIDSGVPVSVISRRFHDTLVEIMVACARELRESEGLEEVYLSGGVFLNTYLVQQAPRRLEEEGFTVYTHSLLPPGDGGISTGQVLVSATQSGLT